jgi:hypothetical protein
MSNLTVSRYEGLLANLDAGVNELRDAEFFDLAETLEDAILFLQVIRSLDILIDDSAPAEKMTGDMETLRQLCVKMKELQNQALVLKAQAADVRIPLDELRLKKIPELMESLEVKTTTFTGLGRVQLTSDLYASTRKGQKEAAMQWLRDCGYEDMIKETYNASSLKALFRRQIVEGVDFPDEIFSVTPFVRASIVKA